ncbi:MAG: rod shape-determining protein MreC [Flavobacteriaceae bacterium]|nr:rod shape-determining protein MreC [Flavobacteriaceae bacterium]
MRNFVDFIIKNINSIIFLILISISITQIFSRNYFQASKFNLFSSSIVNSINEIQTEMFEYFDLIKLNQKLVIENSFLKNNYDYYYENDSIIFNKNYSYTPSKVISNSIKFSKNFITINKGRYHNIEIEDGIITNQGVIGIINNVSDRFATGISILNSQIKINVVLKKSEHFGSLYWNGKNHQIMELEDIPKSANIAIGDTIISGGMSSIFPRNIPIGVICNFKLPESTNYYEVSVKLFEDFGSLRNVYVVKNDFKEEFNDLKKMNE